MTDHIAIHDAEGVRTIAWNRPEKKNALTRAMYSAAAEAINSAQSDPAIKVVMLTGEGEAFTAGNDLNDFMMHPPVEGEPSPVEDFMVAVMTADKPIAVAVNGLAVGIGVTLLLHCDLVYASRMASFSTPFVKLALAPEYASTLTMPAAMGGAKASEMLLLGEKLNAEEAERAGLVARVFAEEEIREQTFDRCRRLARLAPGAVQDAKALLKMTPSEPLADRMKREGRLFAQRLLSEEFKEAATAFMEKREADFSRFGG